MSGTLNFDVGLAFEANKPAFFDVLNNLWHPSNPEGIENIGLAENGLMQTEMKSFINSQTAAESHSLTYGDGFTGSKKLKEAINAIENSAWALCDPGDYVLVGRPYWTTFRSIFGNRAGVNILEVTMGDLDPMGLDAILRFEEVAEQARLEGKRVKAILLCSPNNPLGRCYPEEVLKSYMRLCQNLGIHLISDELYGLPVWHNPSIDDPTSFTSVLSIGAKLTNRRLFNFPSSIADNAVTSFLANDAIMDSFISTNRARLSESYQFVTGFCRANGIPYTHSNVALFVWIILGATAKDTKMTDDEILSRTRQQGWFRVVMAHLRHVLEEGLNRMLRALR
ncbi:pyridoxal phosphate-dependent transferase [Aspergillus terricola var. indicus]